MTNIARDCRQQLLEIFQAALAETNGRARVSEYLHKHPLASPVYLIAFGKAAGAMARGAHEVLGNRIRDGLVVTKRGSSELLPWPVLEAGHPMPDAASLEAGERLIEFVKSVPQDAQVLTLLSGGASALVEALPSGLGLDAAAGAESLVARRGPRYSRDERDPQAHLASQGRASRTVALSPQSTVSGDFRCFRR